MRNSALLLCLLIAGCQTNGADLPRSNIPDAVLIDKAHAAVLATLKDPDSAKFTEVVRVGDYVCGRINSKNGFGGYAGASKFSVSPQGAVWIFAEVNTDPFGHGNTPCFNAIATNQSDINKTLTALAGRPSVAERNSGMAQ